MRWYQTVTGLSVAAASLRRGALSEVSASLSAGRRASLHISQSYISTSSERELGHSVMLVLLSQ